MPEIRAMRSAFSHEQDRDSPATERIQRTKRRPFRSAITYVNASRIRFR